MRDQTIAALAEQWWVAYFMLFKCLLLLIALPLAYIFRKIATATDRFLRYIDAWEPVCPRVFSIKQGL